MTTTTDKKSPHPIATMTDLVLVVPQGSATPGRRPMGLRGTQVTTEKKSPHPIATMADPTVDDVRKAAKVLAWLLREHSGASERYLDSPEPEISFDKVTSPSQLHDVASTCSWLAQLLGQHQAAAFFRAASARDSSAGEHYNAHITDTVLVDEHPHDEHLADLHDKEREYAARALKLGRQLTHRGLGNLVVAWPAKNVDPDQ